MLHPDNLPAQCSNPNCKYVFAFANPIAGAVGANMLFAGCSTSCPKCGSSAAIMNMSSDNSGRIIYSGFFAPLREINDTKKLNALRKTLEAANENFTPEDLGKALTEANPKFFQLQKIIRQAVNKDNLNLIIAILMMILTYLQYQTASKQFEHQKQIDEKALSDDNMTEQEIERKLKELDELINKEIKQNKNNTCAPDKKQKEIKGRNRNLPCPCGSTKKYKACHPDGISEPTWT